MPLIALALVLLLAALAPIVLMPLTLVLRYRSGTARRRARGWVAILNAVLPTLSIGFFVAAAVLTSFWVGRAFMAAPAGLAMGCLLGLLGLRLSRWEPTPESLHYTPNRWLVLALMLLIFSRLLYSLWRAWHAWSATPNAASWLAESGAAGSFAVGGILLGYYWTYWCGLWRRLSRMRRENRVC